MPAKVSATSTGPTIRVVRISCCLEKGCANSLARRKWRQSLLRVMARLLRIISTSGGLNSRDMAERKSRQLQSPICLIYQVIAATYHPPGEDREHSRSRLSCPNIHPDSDICTEPSSLERGGRLVGLFSVRHSATSSSESFLLDGLAKCLFRCRTRTGIVLGCRCWL